MLEIERTAYRHGCLKTLQTVWKEGNNMKMIDSHDDEELIAYGISPEAVRAAEEKRGATSSHIIIDGEGRMRLAVVADELFED